MNCENCNENFRDFSYLMDAVVGLKLCMDCTYSLLPIPEYLPKEQYRQYALLKLKQIKNEQ